MTAKGYGIPTPFVPDERHAKPIKYLDPEKPNDLPKETKEWLEKDQEQSSKKP